MIAQYREVNNAVPGSGLPEDKSQKSLTLFPRADHNRPSSAHHNSLLYQTLLLNVSGNVIHDTKSQ
jgi:hypothetical protein